MKDYDYTFNAKYIENITALADDRYAFIYAPEHTMILMRLEDVINMMEHYDVHVEDIRGKKWQIVNPDFYEGSRIPLTVGAVYRFR